jgi:hypothetical protein
MCRGSIPGIPASRCGRRGRPSERGHGSTASLMELSARAGLAAPLSHYPSYRTWNVHCTSLDCNRCRNAGAAAANFPELSLVVARDRRAPVGSRNSSARLTSPLAADKRRGVPSELNLRAGVIGDGFGHIERGMLAAHVVGAHLAFGDHTRDGRFETRGHFSFFEPVEHQLCC